MKKIAFVYFMLVVSARCFGQTADDLCDAFMDARIWMTNEEQLEGAICIGMDGTLRFQGDEGERFINPRQVLYMAIVKDSQVYEMYPLPYDYNEDGKLETAYFLKIHQANDIMLLTTECYQPKVQSTPEDMVVHHFRAYYNSVIIADRYGNMLTVLAKNQPLSRKLEGLDRYRWILPDQNEKVLSLKLEERDYQSIFGTQYPRFRKHIKDHNLDLKTIEGWIEAIDY